MPTRRRSQLVFLELEELGRTALAWLVIAAFIALIGFFFWRSVFTGSPPLEQHSGLIMAKQIRFAETYEGSLIGRYLLIEEQSGERKWIRVTEDLYQQSDVGMRVRVGEGPAELIHPGPMIRTTR